MDDGNEGNDGQRAEAKSRRSATGSTIKTHLTLLLGLLICGAAFWIELRRAEGGNELSWAYVFEWPLLALFAVYMWWKLLHPEFRLRRKAKVAVIAPEYQGMLAAWQDEVRRLETTRREEEATTPPGQRGDDDVTEST